MLVAIHQEIVIISINKLKLNLNCFNKRKYCKPNDWKLIINVLKKIKLFHESKIN